MNTGEGNLFDAGAPSLTPRASTPVGPLPLGEGNAAPHPAAEQGRDLLADPDCHCCESAECANEVLIECELCGGKYLQGDPHPCPAAVPAEAWAGAHEQLAALRTSLGTIRGAARMAVLEYFRDVVDPTELHLAMDHLRKIVEVEI